MAATKTKKTPAAAQGSMAPEALAGELKTALEKRAKLEFQHQVAPLKNPMELRQLRREIARLKTYIRQKEAAK